MKEMKTIEKIRGTKGLKDSFIIKSKKVEKLVNELDCRDHYCDGSSHVFLTNHFHKVQGHKIQTIIRANKMKDGTWWIKAQ
jgi:hypothetical protein